MISIWACSYFSFTLFTSFNRCKLLQLDYIHTLHLSGLWDSDCQHMILHYQEYSSYMKMHCIKILRTNVFKIYIAVTAWFYRFNCNTVTLECIILNIFTLVKLIFYSDRCICTNQKCCTFNLYTVNFTLSSSASCERIM